MLDKLFDHCGSSLRTLASTFPAPLIGLTMLVGDVAIAASFVFFAFTNITVLVALIAIAVAISHRAKSGVPK